MSDIPFGVSDPDGPPRRPGKPRWLTLRGTNNYWLEDPDGERGQRLIKNGYVIEGDADKVKEIEARLRGEDDGGTQHDGEPDTTHAGPHQRSVGRKSAV